MPQDFAEQIVGSLIGPIEDEGAIPPLQTPKRWQFNQCADGSAVGIVVVFSAWDRSEAEARLHHILRTLNAQGYNPSQVADAWSALPDVKVLLFFYPGAAVKAATHHLS